MGCIYILCRRLLREGCICIRLNNSESYYAGLATFNRQTLIRGSVKVPQTVIYALL